MTAARRITTDRLILREPKAGDLPAYRGYCVSERSRFSGGPFTPEQAFEKLAAMIGHWTLRGFGRYVITREGVPLGHAGPLAVSDGEPPEMTWTLWTAEAEGKGYATEAARAVIAHLLGDLAWPRMLVRIAPDNAASHRMALRLGAMPTDAPAPGWMPGVRTYDLRARASA
jgi:RimJ/RimL family protein N-acetyltransferase